MKRFRRLRSVVVVLGLLAVAWLLRAPLLRAAVAASADAMTGYRIAFDDLDVSSSSDPSFGGGAWSFAFSGVNVTDGSGPVLSADHVRVLAPASIFFPWMHRYAVTVDGPSLVIRRLADGSLSPSPGGAAGGGSGGGGGSPSSLDLRVTNGRVEFDDPNRVLPDARRYVIERLAARIATNAGGATRYQATGELATTGNERTPLVLTGRADPARGLEWFRLRTPSLPVATVANYFINSPRAAALGGAARDVDLVAYAFGGPGRPFGPLHVSGGGTLDDTSLRIPGLAEPATAMRGRLNLYDTGLAAPEISARLGPVPVRLAGGVIDFGQPQLRLGVTGSSDLAKLRDIFWFSRKLPVGGAATFASIIEGPVGVPLVDARLRAGRLSYADFPVEGVEGRVEYHDGVVDVLPASGTYAGAKVHADATISLWDDAGNVVRPRIVAEVAGPAAGIPYAAQAAPGMLLRANGYLEGVGLELDSEGVLAGTSASAKAAGLFHLDHLGDGAFGPLLLAQNGGGRLAGTLYLNRSQSESGFWVAASGLGASDPGNVRLPGLPGFGPPRFSAGSLEGAIAGDGPPSAFRIAGALSANDLQVAGVHIARVNGTVAGGFGAMSLANVEAGGAWGRFRGAGTYAGQELAVAGDYRGSFEQLEAFTGRLGARGPIAGPVALVLGPTRTIVQARGDATGGATVQGVPVAGIDGTLTVRSKQVEVLAADVGVPGGRLALAGAVRPSGGLGVSVAGADARALRRAGSPLDSGRVALIGDFGPGEPGHPVFTGGLAVENGRLAGHEVAGDSDVALARGTAHLDDASAELDGAYGKLAGNVSGIGSGSAATGYDVGVRFREVSLGPLARRSFPARHDIAGNIDADLHVGGTALAPNVAGTLALRAATVSGQFIDEAGGQFALDPAGNALVDGKLLVGSTAARLAYARRGTAISASLAAPAANLADFNDLFDRGDMLAGRGSLSLAFRRAGPSLATAADLDIGGLRVRSFDLGDAVADWKSEGSRVDGQLRFGGASGKLAAAGTLLVPRTGGTLVRMLQRARFNGTASVVSLDLGTWLPVFGYTANVGGRLDAAATVTGPLTAPLAVTRATLVAGSLGKFPIDRFTLAATSTLARTRIDDAELDLLGLHITGKGTVGTDSSAPVALSLHATGDDLGALAGKLMGGGPVALHGRAETDVTVSGTRGRPKIVAGFDVENASIGGVAIPRALGEVAVSGTDLVLSGAELGFAKGSLELAGSLPLQLQPFDIGPLDAPLALDVTASNIDLRNFATLLPAGSTLNGKLNGRVALGGTAGDPSLSGVAVLSDGVLESSFERQRLTAISGRLAFRGNSVILDRLHAETGGGSLEGHGRVRLANLAHPTTDAAYAFDVAAKALNLDIPEYGRGTVDGTLRLTHDPGRAPRLGGALSLQDGVIPFSALLLAAGTTGGPADLTVPPPAVPGLATDDLALGLDLTAARNVRVRSGNVDIGGRGAVHVSGSRSAPVLEGGFESTGGTLTYFNTLFRVQRGTVTFEPDSGVIPDLQAVATTHLTDPDPNFTRNLSGFADVTLDISGPVNNLTIGLRSDPPYDREQILGLLLNAPQLGANTLFDSSYTAITPLGEQGPGNINPNGGRTLAGYEAQRQATAGGDIFATTVGEEAFGVVNAQFTRNLLAPFETAFSEAVGLSAVNINVDYTGSVGLTARKAIDRTVSAIYSTTIGYPYRQSVGFEIQPNEGLAAQVTVFQTVGNEILGLGIPNSIVLPSSASRFGAAEPANGSIGFSVSVQHLFK